MLTCLTLLASCSVSPQLPQISYYATGETVREGPLRYCELDFTSCTDGEIADLAVPAGGVLQISLPSEVFDAPWRLITVVRDADGTESQTDQFFRPGEQLAVTVEPEEDVQLLGVEIQLPSGAEDSDGNPFSRATWSLRTDPDLLAG